MIPDPRIDAYIDSRAEFARPILRHLREAIHAACPEAGETIKWGMPAFTLDGRLLATMAGFKAHATFGFWRADVADAPKTGEAMGQFGRIRSLDDLPDDRALADLIRKAAARSREGPAAPRRKAEGKPPPQLPPDLAEALETNPEALATYHAFPPSAQRDYVDWICEAKRPATRASRIAQAVEWLAEGKRRHWRYERC